MTLSETTKSETITLLQKKFLKIFGYLIFIRVGLYIPVPNVDLDIFLKYQISNPNPLFDFSRSLTGSTYLGFGALGVLPYINSSILIQFLIPNIPNLERLQKEEGEVGRQQISRYTRYLALLLAVGLSTGIAFTLVKPVVFNWNLILALKVICSLTTGSMFSIWIAELITKENLGNGYSILVFINIIGGLPPRLIKLLASLETSPFRVFFITLIANYVIFCVLFLFIIIFQESYIPVKIVSARQLMESASPSTGSEAKSSFIPIKLNIGGVMPIFFSTTLASLLRYPIRFFLAKFLTGGLLIKGITLLYTGINFGLIVFFSIFYALFTLKPTEIEGTLTKGTYNVPGKKQGKETTQYFQKKIIRVAFTGGIILGFMVFSPTLIVNSETIIVFENLTSLIISVGVITDVTAKIRGFLVSKNYEKGNKNE
jgi:preprotein translocase subunit SecY